MRWEQSPLARFSLSDHYDISHPIQFCEARLPFSMPVFEKQLPNASAILSITAMLSPTVQFSPSVHGESSFISSSEYYTPS